MNRSFYLAAPLFSDSEKSFNVQVSQALERHGSVFLPQRDGSLVPDLLASGMALAEALEKIFHTDLAAIRASDIVVAVLDGRVIDEGVAMELGYAHALGKTCWGLKTDIRALAPFGDNPMIQMTLAQSFRSVVELDGFLCDKRHAQE